MRAKHITFCFLLAYFYVTPSVAKPTFIKNLQLEQAVEQAIINAPELQAVQSHTLQLQANQLQQQNQLIPEYDLLLKSGAREYQHDAQQTYFFYLRGRWSIYSFGLGSALDTLKQAQHPIPLLLQNEHKNAIRLAVMRSFFDILIADQQNIVENERIAVTFVRLADLRESFGLGKLLEEDLLRAERNYQAELIRFQSSQESGRLRRLELGTWLGEPGTVIENAIAPDWQNWLTHAKAKIDVSHLYTFIPANPHIKLLDQQIAAAKAQQQVAIHTQGTNLNLFVQAGDNQQRPTNEGRWRAELQLNIPLNDSGTRQSAVYTARARLINLQADKTIFRRQLLSRINALWLRWKSFSARLNHLEAQRDFADAHLDTNRSLYELERAANLGTSFVESSILHLNELMLYADIAITLTELSQLLNTDLITLSTSTSQGNNLP